MPTNNFKLYSRRFLDATPIESEAGFELALELTVKATLQGRRLAEVPTTWRDRTGGESRFRLRKWLPHYLRWYRAAFAGRLRRQRWERAWHCARLFTPRSSLTGPEKTGGHGPVGRNGERLRLRPRRSGAHSVGRVRPVRASRVLDWAYVFHWAGIIVVVLAFTLATAPVLLAIPSTLGYDWTWYQDGAYRLAAGLPLYDQAMLGGRSTTSSWGRSGTSRRGR